MEGYLIEASIRAIIIVSAAWLLVRSDMWPFSQYPTVSLENLAGEYDYIILGGGTAGCVLASRLSADGNTRVLLVERGEVADGWASGVPLFSSDFLSDGSRTIITKSLPQSELGDQVFDLYGGKALGGSSRINAMIYTRGLPGEYNAWSQAGREGWGFKDILPYFLKSEDNLDPLPKPWHSRSGEWKTRSHSTDHWSNTAHVINAAHALGIPYVNDLNSPEIPSVHCGRIHFTIDADGRRSSVLTAFLHPKLVASRPNLNVCTRTIALKIELGHHEEKGPKAEGVWLLKEKGESSKKFVRARKEIIICAGPFGSPHILMLSGIGPREHLESKGITVMKDLTGVGSHLQDHFGVPLAFHVPMKDSLVILQEKIWVFFVHLITYLLWGTGFLLAPVVEAAVFVRSSALDDSFQHVVKNVAEEDPENPDNLPDIEIMPIPWANKPGPESKNFGGFSLFALLLHPKSTGTVRLRSADPRDGLDCDLRFLSDKHDRDVMRKSVRFGMKLKEQMLNQGYNISDCRVPKSLTDEDIDAFATEWGRTSYHYTSTCRMAPEDDANPGVVDDRLRVHGVEGLRVADSSAFPHIPGVHMQATTVALAEKCAAMIKEDSI